MESWRRHVVRLAAFAFILQCLGLFAAHHGPVRAGADAALAAAASMAAADDCPHHHHSHGAPPAQGDDSGGCPMCQAIGCALPGAPALATLARPDERLLGVLSIAPPDFPPRDRPPYAASPRGPPILV